MSGTSKIEWTERTWNPVRGCSIVSPGCVHCYAMKQAHRFSGPGRPYEGLTKQTSAGPQWTGKVRVVPELLDLPLRWRKPSRIFVNSMSDLFHENVPERFIRAVWGTMAMTPRHTYQILTKRPERMATLVPRFAHEHTARDGSGWPLPNVWLGTSCEDPPRAGERIPHLLQTPAAVRFVSAEPLLGPITLSSMRGCQPFPAPGPADPPRFLNHLPGYLHWVIVGGESGPGARPCDVAWVRSIVQQCRAAGVPVFVKQLGANVHDRNDAGFDADSHVSADGPDAGQPVKPEAWPDFIAEDDRVEHDPDGYQDGYQGAPVRIWTRDRKGADPAEWPHDLRVRQFPTSSEAHGA